MPPAPRTAATRGRRAQRGQRALSEARSAEFAGFTTWLDLYPAFVDKQGRQQTRLFVDGLHPSEAGYTVWRDRLVPALAAARAAAR